MKNKIFLPVVFVLALLIGAGGMYAGMSIMGLPQAEPNSTEQASSSQGDTETSGASDNTETAADENEEDQIRQAMDTIKESYVNEVEDEQLIEGAISGMIETLDDPYSDFMNESTAEEFMNSLDSSFEGIGAEVSMTDGRVTIVAPFRDSPAEDAGLRPNDQILEIDGENIEGLSLYDAVLKIRGEKGTTVTLTIDRPGASDTLEIDVVRDEIPVETVYGEVVEENDTSIGVLEIRSFSENTAERFEEELTELESEGIDGLMIDVRGNPGGFLQSVEDIGDLLIPEGEVVVQIEDRDGERITHVSNMEGEKEYPIVTLIDGGSASASEILAAALQEAGGHDLVGTTTFGKGTVQQTIPMGDGSQLKLTLFRWLTSDGNNIHEEGVAPTVEVEQPDYFYAAPIDAEETLVLDMLNEDIENAQLMLDGLGYDPDREDGYFDEATEEAVMNFQEDEGLEVTGEINEETADTLQERVIESVQDKENDLQYQEGLELLIEQAS
ncbi:S41 family peptidase [Alkalicoccus daliensis]|uniref:Carboxyl-terminal processing protease n=1 Tax=Alkalicoccus daliensis TaxID=745820 RepID=A0A1H0JQF5_9BACI|nr:S41 family peptidase [Alkalicoccus daliensis]SDO45986.1 carboxyl-terminal processing protease [Alkalicoccus daliensis]